MYTLLEVDGALLHDNISERRALSGLTQLQRSPFGLVAVKFGRKGALGIASRLSFRTVSDSRTNSYFDQNPRQGPSPKRLCTTKFGQTSSRPSPKKLYKKLYVRVWYGPSPIPKV